MIWSKATLNRVTKLVVERAKAAGLALAPFTVHDLRHTGSTLLIEAGSNAEWIEKCLAHESGRSSRSVYNKAEYADQRRHMMQEWANMVEPSVQDIAYASALPRVKSKAKKEYQKPGTFEFFADFCSHKPTHG